MCIQPNFILLDEPFSGIDPIAVLELQKIIFDLKASGIGVLITDHNVRETLSVTDRAYIIAEGRIFRSGTPHELGNDVEVRRVYLGEGFTLGDESLRQARMEGALMAICMPSIPITLKAVHCIPERDSRIERCPIRNN